MPQQPSVVAASPGRPTLVGREAELEQLVLALAADRPIAVLGEAGIGKTALVRAAAEAAGRPLHEGGGFATLAETPYLAIQRAVGHAVVGDPGLVAARVERAVGPDVLFLDDLQWIDPASRDVLGLLIDRVACVVAIRDGDPSTPDAMAWLVDRGAAVIRLVGLAEPLALELASRLHPDVSAGRLRRLVSLAGGNPLLIEELVAHGKTSSSLARAILGQIQTLSGADRRALELLAVAGQPLPAEAIGAPDARLRRLGLIEATGDGVAIRHALIAQAILESIGPKRRTALHATLATVLSDPAEQARHLLAAGHQKEAYRVATSALGTTTDPRTRASLLAVAAETSRDEASRWRVEAALQFRAIGSPGLAIDLLESPIEGDDDLRALGAAVLAGSLDHEGRHADAMAAIDGARDLRPDPASDGAIELAAIETVILVNLGRLRDGLAVAQEALRVAGDAPRRYRLVGTLAAIRLYAGETDRLEDLESAVADTFAAGDGNAAAGRAMDLYYLTLAYRGGPAAAAVALDAADRVERIGLHTRASELRAERAQATIFSGDLHAAVVSIDSLLEEPLGLLSRQRLLYDRGLALGLLGRVDEAERTLAEVDAIATDDFDGRGSVLWCWAEVALWSGQPRRALELAQASMAFTAFNDAEYVLPSLARAWAEVELGRSPTSTGSDPPPFRDLAGANPELRGLEALAVGDPALAAAAFDEAERLWTGFNVPRALICRWAAGEARRRAGAPDAVARLRDAMVGATAIGFEPLAARARRSLRLAGEHPASPAGSTRSSGLLTAREAELVQLVERGLSNIEIARRLGLGRPTVARMLASAMGKLGVERRTQLAARELV